jgi:hypothetical protein
MLQLARHRRSIENWRLLTQDSGIFSYEDSPTWISEVGVIPRQRANRTGEPDGRPANEKRL